MRDMGEAMARAFGRIDPGIHREATLEEEQEFDEILNLAVAWEAGEVSLDHAAGFGTMVNHRGEVSPAYTRHQCAWRRKRDPRIGALRKLQAAIHTPGGEYIQGGGWVSHRDCDAQAEAIGQMFPGMNHRPISVPWEVE